MLSAGSEAPTEGPTPAATPLEVHGAAPDPAMHSPDADKRAATSYPAGGGGALDDLLVLEEKIWQELDTGAY